MDFSNLAPRLTIDDGPIKGVFAGFGVARHVLSGNITKDGDQRRPGGYRRAKRNFFAFYTLNLLSRLLSSRSTKGLGGGVLLLEAVFDIYSRGSLLRMEQDDGLQETADRVARAKFSLRRSEYFCLCTSS